MGFADRLVEDDSLLSDALDSPEILELVQQLRKDPRTSRIPIGLLPRLEYMDRAKRIARDSERVKAFPWPYQPETAKFELEELATVIPDGWPTANQRLDQAVESMQLLLQIVDLPRVFGFEDLHQHQDLLVERMYSPAMGATALQVVGHLSTPEGQTALVDYSNQGSLPVELRTAAVDAFETAVQKRGVLLTTRQIQTQYDRYNMSEFSGPETQQLLGRVLDIIEKPSSVGAR